MKFRALKAVTAVGLACLMLAGCVSEGSTYTEYRSSDRYDRFNRYDGPNYRYRHHRDRDRHHGRHDGRRPDRDNDRPHRDWNRGDRPERPGYIRNDRDGRNDRGGRDGRDRSSGRGGPDRSDRGSRGDRVVVPQN